MRKYRNRRNRNEKLDRELSALLLAIGGTMQRIAGSLQILCAKRQMEGVRNYEKR